MTRALFFAAVLAAFGAAAPAAAAPAAAAPRPDAVKSCDFYGTDSLSPDRVSNASGTFEDFARQPEKVVDACRKAVEIEPKAGRLHAQLARALAVAGDAAGAFAEARIGSRLGSPMAANLLGVMYADGEGVRRDYAAALALLREAAKQGHPHAHFNLGVMLANGWGVAADDAEAAVEFNRAAAGRDPQAMLVLGDWATRGRGVAPDPGQAERWLKRAAAQADTEGHRNPARVVPLGRAAPDTAALVAWYEARARAGELWARTYLGALHESGQWVKQDYARAIALYTQAGEAGDGLAQRRMAVLYHNGWGVPGDDAQARRWAMMGMDQHCDALARADPGANECDRLAADRYDPDKVVEGTPGYCMLRFASRAVAACTRAVAEFPATVRFRSQLARALAHAGRFDDAQREAKGAAAKGSTPAMLLLGAMSERGLGAPKDESAALAWYRKAAELGDERAIQIAMNDARLGVGVPKGSPEAKALSDAMNARFLEKRNQLYAASDPAREELARAAKGDARTQHNLAFRLERERRYDEAVLWYRRAAEQGFGPSQLTLASLYETGTGVKADAAEAKKWYRKSTELGDGEALYRLAVLSDQTGDSAEAAKLYGRGIAHDDYRAMLGLGELHERGRGVPRDAARAVQLYERAADRSRWAQFKLGLMYAQGQGIPKDSAKAIAWWKKAADGGNAKAQNNLGVMYDRGMGVPRDYGEALERYLAAGELPQARGNLESFFEAGRGAPSLPIAEAAWYRRGADAGVVSAQYKLGTFYAAGHGVVRDDCKALELLSSAYRGGHPKAREALAGLLSRLAGSFEKGERPRCGLLPLPATIDAAQAAQILYRQAASLGQAPVPERRVWPTGFDLDPGEDAQRAMRVRAGSVAQMQAVAMDPELYTVIQWWPGANDTR